MSSRLLPVLILLVPALLVPTATAVPSVDPNPAVPRWVDATWTFSQPDVRTTDLQATILVYEYNVEGETYTADALGDQFHRGTRAGAKVGAAFVSAMEKTVRTTVESTLAKAFPTATRNVSVVDVDESTLVARSGNPYEPGVRVNITARVVRTNQDLGLGSLTEAGIAAAFSSGAAVTTSFQLPAEPGFNMTYEIQAPASPPGLTFASAGGTGTLADAGRRAIITVDNTLGVLDKSTTADLVLRDATVTPPAAEAIDTSVEIALGTPGDAGIPLSTSVRADLRALSVKDRFPSALPAKAKLDFVSADGLRLLHAAGVVTEAMVKSADDELKSTIAKDLSSALGASVTVTGGLSRADLTAPATKPYDGAEPIRFLADAASTYALEGDAGGDLDLAFDVGATVTLDLDLYARESGKTTFVLRPPPDVVLTPATGGTVAADKRSATFIVDAGAKDPKGKLSMRGANAPAFTKADADLNVLVDLKDLDIKLGEAMNGDFGDLVVDVVVRGELAVIEVPAEVRNSFDRRVSLDFLSADAVRLLKARGVLSAEKLAELEGTLLTEVRKNLGTALGATIEVTGGFEASTLAAGGATDAPVVFEARTSFRKALAGEPSTQAAIALYTQEQSFALPKVQGLDTSYTIVLPRGLAATDLQTKGGTGEVGKSEDGRDQVTVTPEGDRADVTVAMAVTPTFVLVKFWPLVLLAVLLLVLIVGSPIAIVVLRRRKRAGKQG